MFPWTLRHVHEFCKRALVWIQNTFSFWSQAVWDVGWVRSTLALWCSMSHQLHAHCGDPGRRTILWQVVTHLGLSGPGKLPAGGLSWSLPALPYPGGPWPFLNPLPQGSFCSPGGPSYRQGVAGARGLANSCPSGPQSPSPRVGGGKGLNGLPRWH